MVQSNATTMDDYLKKLPEERREMMIEIRKVILENLPEGYEERMNWGMISYEIPLETYPDTYNKQPLSYVAVASQKRHMAIYLMGCYMDQEQTKLLHDAFDVMGVKPNMGKSCVRFTKLEKIPLETIGKLVGMMSVDDYIKRYESSRKK
jgi:uncharacterized protein YdhG (YjbR/CyaY superfamily)